MCTKKWLTHLSGHLTTVGYALILLFLLPGVWLYQFVDGKTWFFFQLFFRHQISIFLDHSNDSVHCAWHTLNQLLNSFYGSRTPFMVQGGICGCFSFWKAGFAAQLSSQRCSIGLRPSNRGPEVEIRMTFTLYWVNRETRWPGSTWLDRDSRFLKTFVMIYSFSIRIITTFPGDGAIKTSTGTRSICSSTVDFP